jgi:hypothetical protein
MYSWLKLLGALLLLVSLAFPMSTCSHYEDAEGRRVRVAEGEAPPEGVRKVISEEYALEDFHPDDPGDWLRIFAFAWPLLAFGALRLRRRGRVALAIRIAEPLLIGGSILAVDFISTFLADSRATGAYLAFAALGLYAIATVWEDLIVYREWKAPRT